MAESLELLTAEITRRINEDFTSIVLPGLTAVGEPFVKLTPEDIDGTQVRVFPTSLEGEYVDREVENETNDIAVGVAQNVVTGPETWALINYLQEVKNFLAKDENQKVDNGLADPNHVCGELAFPIESAPLFDQNLLRQAQIFFGTVVFSYVCETVRR